jgi:predicted phage tail protein
MPDTRNYGNVTLLAVSAQASNNLSSMSARQFNVIATRKIKTVTSTGLSSTTSATRSVAAALADMATNTVYGGGIAAANIDWAALYALDQTLVARGDYLDVRFDSASTLWEALTQAGVVARTKPFMQGGVMHFARDQEASVPVALFSMRNIVQNSLSINYLTPTNETSDSVQVTYFDKNTWQQTTVSCVLAGSTSNNPAKITMLGITERDQAFREGLYQSAANKYRRKVIKFSTEAEGFIPAFGDLIAIAHDIPAWGQTAEVTVWDSGTRTLTVNETLTWTTGATHYVGLRKRDGSIDGPFVATQGASPNNLVLAVLPSFMPYIGLDEERTHIAFGPGDTWRQPARVVSVQPRGLYQVEITAVNEDPSVHTAETGRTAPALTYSQLPKTSTLPAVSGLNLLIDVTGATPQYVASWNASPGADHYVVEISFDGGTNWAPLATEFGTSHRWAANHNASASVRVAAVNIGRGAWATASVSYASAPSAPMGFSAEANLNRLKLDWAQNLELDVVGYEVRTTDSGWGTAGAVFVGFATTAMTNAPAPGVALTLYLRAFDFLGNYSATSASVTSITPAVDNITGFTTSFFDTSATSATVTLSWANVAPLYGLRGYQISYGPTTVTTASNTITLPADWTGDRAFTVKTVDQLGNISTGYTQNVTKLAPASPTNFRVQVIDNTVMLYWGQPTVTTLPISHYLLRRGTAWASADVDYGRKDGLFTTISETAGGTYTYWVATVDTDGNVSVPSVVSAVAVSYTHLRAHETG